MREPGEDWGAFLAENPTVLWGLVADVVKAVKAGEGEKRTGRRPAVSVGSLDELYDILFPACYASEPFAVTFGQLLAETGMSQRAFAVAARMHQATVNRLLTGRATPDLHCYERIAAALKVRPTYFPEYRALKIGQLVTETLLGNPMLSAEAVRRLFGATA